MSTTKLRGASAASAVVLLTIALVAAFACSAFALPMGVVGTLAGPTGFESAVGVAAGPDGNVYAADMDASVILKIAPNGAVTTFAGQSGVPGSQDGTGTLAQFRYPEGVSCDASGNVWVADTGNNLIRKIAPDGTVSTVAGISGPYGFGGMADGDVSVAMFRAPRGIAVDATGTVFVADSGNNAIRVIATNNQVSTLATGFVNPRGIALDASGNVVVADYNQQRVCSVSPAGDVTVLAGSGVIGSTDSTGTLASFWNPEGVAIDGTGNVFVTDSENDTVRMIAPDHSVTTVVGSVGAPGFVNGAWTTARFNQPRGIGSNAAGNLFLGDNLNRAVRYLTFGTTVYSITPTASGVGSITPDVTQYVGVGSDSATFTFTPGLGHHVSNVLVDGSSIGTPSAYAFRNVIANHSIAASFAIDTFTIVPTATLGGSVSPATTQVVDWGTNATFTVTPDAHYHIVDVLVDGVSVGATSTYTFTNVTANHTIAASFAIDTYTLTPIPDPTRGTITPSTTQTVAWGTNATFTITPGYGYYLSGVLVDGSTVGTPSVYTFTNVTANHTIAPVFTYKTMTRLSGSNAYSTSVAAEKNAFPGWAGVKDLVIAPGENGALAQGLAAPGLAGAYGSPLLLVATGNLPANVATEISAMPPGLNVHVVGSTAAISNATYNAIKALPTVATIERISGSDLYGTAAAVATKMKSVLGTAFPTTVLIANGNQSNWIYDSIAAGTVSEHMHYPVLLVTNSQVPAATSQALTNLGLSTRYIVGNTTAVSSSVQSALGVSSANRISGTDRFATGATLATRARSLGWLSNTYVGFASTSVDALIGAPAMGRRGGPILYVNSTSIPSATSTYLTGAKAEIWAGYVYGGTSVVSNAVQSSLLNLIK